jgi:hypothetical protein
MRVVLAIISCLLFLGCQQGNRAKNVPQNRNIAFRLPDGFIGRGIENAYVVYSDSIEKHNGRNVSTIKAIKPIEFATILNSVKPQKSIGQRIKYTAWVRSKDVANWAGLWLRIDPADPMRSPNLGFDNMSNRPIKGTKEWTKYEIVLDVPEGAASIVYGALLDGNGQIWVDSMDINITDKLTPRTDTIGGNAQKVL